MQNTSSNEIMIGDEPDIIPNQQDVMTCSGRTVKLMDRMRESLQQCEQGIISYQAHTYESDETYYDAMHEDNYSLQDAMMNPIAFLSETQEDTMYFDQAMKAPDCKEFIKACVKEVNNHIDQKHWELIP